MKKQPLMKSLVCALGVLTALPVLAEPATPSAAPVQAPPPAPPPPPHGPHGPRAQGLSPEVAQRLGIPQATVQKVQDLTFAANDAVIGLEADHKRAQLALERELLQSAPNEATVKDLVEKVGRAETAVRQNRVGLMVAIKKVLGPDTWQKVEAEMGPGFGRHPMPPAPPAAPAAPAAPATSSGK